MEVMNTEFFLNPKIAVKVNHFSPISVGSELHRVIYEIYDTSPSQAGGLLKFYEVWVSETYIEDHNRLSKSPNKNDILDFAMNYLINRFKLCGNNIPAEGGAYLTNVTGENIGNPRSFPLKIPENEKPKLVKTTIMLPEETQKWLKNYSHETGVGMGEAIRRVIGDFEAGTARIIPSGEENNDGIGVPRSN